MKHVMVGFLVGMWVLSFGFGDLDASARGPRGIVGKMAPALTVDRWFNLPVGKRTVDVSAYKDDVLVMFFFQSWCPGCHSRGFPTLQKLQKHYAGMRNVKFLAIQTVFEGFGTNTAERAKAETQRLGLTIPIGHDAGGGRGSRVMKRYRSGGTPWFVIVAKDGIVRFDGFHVATAQAKRLIDKLRASGTQRR